MIKGEILRFILIAPIQNPTKYINLRFTTNVEIRKKTTRNTINRKQEKQEEHFIVYFYK